MAEMVRFTLLENALDSVETGLDYFSRAGESQNRRDYKQCLLYLFQAAELLLKAVVSRQGVGTIFYQNSLNEHCKDPACPTQTELHQCQSVNIKQLCQLLKEHHPLDFSETAYQMMESVAQMRNNLQHFALDISPGDLAMQLSELYRHVFRPAFILLQDDETHDSWNSMIRRQYIALETRFMDISTPKEYALARCPACESWSHYIVYDGESYPVSSHCICCNFRLTDLQEWDFQHCPECGWHSVIYVPKYKAGACLCHTCYYSKEEGFVPMEPCKCGGYRMEEHCSHCDPEDE
ncbi:hypothetical protein [Dickeya dianthicola]|uniref:hypothetical protein n=1 Tax=Dickeya dianthicola TaxID=204039 RepID=UPI0003A0D07B|nr:hypothetical protein [Dickeya dianthicola]MCI4031818.1 hypothetical protein [Dickeya dianthicola]MCI4175196.1 hypothetical protein [Dickeya dianthicola]MCI4179431.1 hypothetical protein [Dickeya dianthicola]MCI4182394.1 hypothetical protein [Dickeya dianthicola]MCI4196780.1 hypothetical protein [Dickeya dianthicola]